MTVRQYPMYDYKLMTLQLRGIHVLIPRMAKLSLHSRSGPLSKLICIRTILPLARTRSVEVGSSSPVRG